MDRFYIITNSDKDPKFAFTGRIVEYLEKFHKSCTVQRASRKQEGNFHYTDPSKIHNDKEINILL